MTPAQLARCTGTTPGAATRWLGPITAAMSRYAIDSPVRQAAFLAQIGVESAHLTALVEDLNYAADVLRRLWPTHFTPEQAELYGRTGAHPANQEMIANLAYGGRFGNGPASTGDGWKYRGRGLIQTTFKANYVLAGKALGLDLLGNPDQLAQPEGAALSAAYYWESHGCNMLADRDMFTRITSVINGGFNGLQDRMELWKVARETLV